MGNSGPPLGIRGNGDWGDEGDEGDEGAIRFAKTNQLTFKSCRDAIHRVSTTPKS
ncbi:hypothetical protein FDUTEX481_04828 [Tolypothrix sp. PCC 7601]|nr:hypothetical protein FDUTEX481_04828 [Tolypothrix sp. PCC 7601]